MNDRWDFHFWNGIKFDYPMCCIIYFCNVQTNWGEQQGSLYERVYREAYEENQHCHSSRHNRAMCPDCLMTEKT